MTKLANEWIRMEERQPEKYGKYRVMRRLPKGFQEDELLWNGSSFVTNRGSLTSAVDAWMENGAEEGTKALAEAGQAQGAGAVSDPGRLAVYEERIRLYKEQIGTGYIGIGRTLTEAKQAGVVPHGEWENWVTRTTGLNPRQAQRCMQAAAEIREGSALARLEMSKALMLLSSGLDEETREEVAGKAAEDGATVRQLKAEIQRIRTEKDGALAEAERIRQAKDREDAENAETVKALKLQVIQESGAAAEIRAALKKAEADRDALKGQLEATVSAYQKRMDEEAGNAYRRGLQDKAAGMERDIRKEFQGKIDYLNGQKRQAEERVKDLQAELEDSRKDGSQAWDNGYRAGMDQAAEIRREVDGKRTQEIDSLQEALDASEKELEGIRCEAESLRRNQGDLLAAAEEAEKRAADAEAELEALRAAGPEGKDPAWKVIKMAADRFRMECEMLPILDAPGVLRGEKQIAPCLDWMETWLGVMRETLAGAIQSEGAVK